MTVTENRLFFTEAPFIPIFIYEFIICSTIHVQKIDDFIAVKFYLILSMYERTDRRMYIDPLCLSTVWNYSTLWENSQRTRTELSPIDLPSLRAPYCLITVATAQIPFGSERRWLVFKQPVGRFQRRATGNQAR